MSVQNTEQFHFTLKCLKQFSKICELHYEQCDCLICALCIASFDHELHFKVHIFKQIEEKKEENPIYPKYRDTVSEIPIQR